ncbi:Rpn family recombination-promoting nuclease/putative transposase [Skermanella rosea]|uniref:Rpn family recombination-promoting nuclease/putative transposase n=1 Tax=Skermanella rosea TaxID=1817965 RepID=UPI0019334E10|nr:Rpn family recombination-promoting nuclease/putative transposase [Skermanella rosea]UEM02307.1 Rpn family recombination-promoting nuclease/putative transposase [Skermanella rosea]
MGQQHDLLFRALLDDPVRAGILIRDYLPADIAARLGDEPPVPLDGSFVDWTLTPSWVDRLFSVRLRDGGTLLIYVLLEHKSHPDPRTPLQVLGYLVDIWESFVGDDASRMRRLPPIVPLVFYHGRGPWTVPTSVIDAIGADEGLRDFRYVVCNIVPIPDDQLSSDPEVRAALLPLKYVYRQPDPEMLLEAVLSGLREGSPLAQKVLYYMLDMYPRISVDMMRTVNGRVRPDREQDMVSLAAQQWLDEGRAEGWVGGKAEGKLESIRMTLETRFGPIPAAVENSLRRTPHDQLDQVLRRSLTAESLDAVFPEDHLH